MFVERDTGPRQYFEVPLARALAVFRDAYAASPGLARTVRGPVMSAFPGKLVLDGVAEPGGEPAFVLRYLQARDPALVGQPLFARFDPAATWYDQLVGCDARSMALLDGRNPALATAEPVGS
jgi:hypothetical protein